MRRQTARTVLIIEDDDDLLKYASRVAELEGYQVLKARDGNDGIRLAREASVALVMLDLRLPVRDGWKVLALLKGEPALSGIPVIVFSASAEKSKRTKALEMGAADYLVKPVGASSLKEAISRAICHAN